MKKKIVLTTLIGLVLAILVSVVGPVAAQSNGGGVGLSKHDRALLAEAIANGESTVTLLIVSTPGSNRRVASGIQSLGGVVRYREDDIHYISAIVPVDKVDAAAALSGIQALDLNEIIPVDDRRLDTGTEAPQGIGGFIPQSAPNASTPRANPYMPTQDIGAAQFVDANPTWDGRGVTIGILDFGVTLDHPSLLTTSTGERKIIDSVTSTDPSNDPTWVDMQAQASGSSFVFNSVTYTAPVAGAYRIGTFFEGNIGADVGRNVNRDGDSTDVFAVLWNTTANQVWVDTNQNNNFADDMAMTDYKVNYDVNYFGTDNPATAIAERMPFVVQTDGSRKVINIGIVITYHGSHVAGVAAGNSLFGGSMSGVAPGAQIVSVRVCRSGGCPLTAQVEGMLYAAKQSNVDIISMSIGSLPALNDGNSARAALFNNIIETYNVQMFIVAGNSGPGMNTVLDPAVTTLVMSVGSYISDDTYLAAYGKQVYEDDNLHDFSSRGPREDGGFKPNIVASGAAISTIPMWQNPSCWAQTCPVGYALDAGTSMATPQAAGAAALLLSAAQQVGVQHQPAQIRQAMSSSTRYLYGRYQAYEQGHGLLDVGAAWDLLKTNIKTVEIQSAVEVNTILSGFLATPGLGVGIYDREGVAAGDSYTRTYTFTRTSGPGGTKTYNLIWIDNDGTFSSAGSISLPKNVSVILPVTVNPTSSGPHSALLYLDDPSVAGVEYATMNTVIAAHPFAAPDYSLTQTGSLGPGQFKSFFFNVPAGTPAFKVDMIGGGPAGAGAIRFLRWTPFGTPIESNVIDNCYNGAPIGCLVAGTPASPTSRTVANPQSGVWEVTVDARFNSDIVSAPFSITATILSATVEPNPDVIPAATIGIPVARSYTITNALGAFIGLTVGTNMGSAFIDTPTIAHQDLKPTFVTIPTGAASLRATIGSPSDPAADLDLYIFNCTTGTCVQAGSSADSDSDESVTIHNPTAGLWAVLVDAFSVPAGTTTYSYVDVFAHPSFGTVSVIDMNALHPAGAMWIVPGTVTVNTPATTGRVLLGNVQVLTDTNTLLGSGDVIVQSVMP